MSHSVCAGPSNPRPGYATVATLTSAAIAAAVTAWSESPALGDIIAGIIGGVFIDLGTLCSNDPPPDPGLTDTLLAAAMAFDSTTASQAAIKSVTDWFINHYWYMACACANGQTPGVPVVVPPPTVGANPGLPSGSSDSTCWTAESGFTVPIVSDFSPHNINCNVLFPGTTTVTVPPVETGGQAAGLVMPPGVKTITVGGTATGSAPGPLFNLAIYDTAVPPNHLVTHTFDLTNNSGTVTVGPQTFTVPSNAGAWMAVIEPYISGGPVFQGSIWEWSLTLSYTCGTGTNVPTVPCCPPDTSTDLRLQQIQALLQAIWEQQSTAADTLKPGTVHSNLSGNGSVLLAAECAALQVHVHQPIPQLGVNPGTPDYYFSMGFVTSYAVGSPLKGWRLVYTDQIFPVATFADQVGYTLPFGITIDITEMLPATAAG